MRRYTLVVTCQNFALHSSGRLLREFVDLLHGEQLIRKQCDIIHDCDSNSTDLQEGLPKKKSAVKLRKQCISYRIIGLHFLHEILLLGPL